MAAGHLTAGGNAKPKSPPKKKPHTHGKLIVGRKTYTLEGPVDKLFEKMEELGITFEVKAAKSPKANVSESD